MQSCKKHYLQKITFDCIVNYIVVKHRVLFLFVALPFALFLTSFLVTKNIFVLLFTMI